MENEVEIRITSKDLSGDGFKTANAKAKKFGALLTDEMGSAGNRAGVELTKGMGLGFELGGPQLKAGLALLAVGAAPAIGASLSAAVLGGLGTGGLIGGIALAARDPRVKAAGEEFAEQAFGSLDRVALPFVGQTIGALSVLGDAVDDAANKLSPGLNKLSGEITPLVNGITGLADNVLPSLNDGLIAAAPVLRAVSNSLPRIGTALGNFFDDVSEDPDGAVMAIEAMAEGVSDTIEVTGELIKDLTQMYEWGVNAGAAVSGAFEDIFGWTSLIAPHLGLFSELMGKLNDDWEAQADAVGEANEKWPKFSTNVGDAAGALYDAEQAAADLKAAIDDLFDVTMSSEEANVAWHKGLRELRKELEDGTRGIGLNSEAGLRNREALDDMVGAAERVRDANIAAKMPIEEANAKFLAQIDALQALAVKSGVAKSEAEAFFSVWKNIPLEQTKRLNLQMQVSQGSVQAWSMFRAAERQSVEGHAHGGIIGAASGGARGGMTWVGEQGPELVRLPFGSTVIPSGTSEAMAAAGGGGGGQRVTLVVDLRNASAEVRALIQKIVKVEGGGSVDLAFGTVKK